METRTSEIKRNTAETKIELKLCIDGKGEADVNTGCGFMDHMLTLFAKHGRFNLYVKCDGDINVDDHHSVEDIGICLGKAFADAAGDFKGINRYAHIILPMDEALILTAVDISGRSYLSYQLENLPEKVGSFDTELGEEFMLAFVRNFPITLHIKQLAGSNGHHILEGMFKALGRTLKEALKINSENPDEIPSTKGVL
ncbi:MAG: imidazoleglycerol-phosphate dehydratase HisB [Ruminococcaceae bacterium]|nr:imidazoleglycerol-phosphate dehydratase HisB [Oscillospiraceae bacterium]